MRKIIRILVGIMGFSGALQALAVTPVPLPITGNLGAIQGTGQPYAGVSIQLQNCQSPVSITGYFGIVQQGYQIQASPSGVITGSVWPNDLITCNGTTGNSQYSVVLMNNGIPSGTTQCYQVTSTQGAWNMTTQQPISCSNPPPNPQDSQFRNLNVTGCLSVSGSGCTAVNLLLGTSAQFPVMNALGNTYIPQSLSGDGTLSSLGLLTISKLGGIAIAPSATIDATNATNITSGTLNPARIGGSFIASAPTAGQTVTQPVSTTLAANRFNGVLYASQFQTPAGTGNNGIANAFASADCASGCTVVAEPTYSSVELAGMPTVAGQTLLD